LYLSITRELIARPPSGDFSMYAVAIDLHSALKGLDEPRALIPKLTIVPEWRHFGGAETFGSRQTD